MGTLTACGSGGSDDPVVGEWDAKTLTQNGETFESPFEITYSGYYYDYSSSSTRTLSMVNHADGGAFLLSETTYSYSGKQSFSYSGLDVGFWVRNGGTYSFSFNGAAIMDCTLSEGDLDCVERDSDTSTLWVKL